MSFKAHLGTTGFMKDKETGHLFRLHTTPTLYKFTKNKIHTKGDLINIFNLVVFDQLTYTITKLDKDHEQRFNNCKYQVTFSNGVTADLITSWWQTQRLRWTHGLTWWQQEQSWITKTLITTLVGIAIAYFISYRVGFQDGLKKGLESASQRGTSQALLPLQKANEPKTEAVYSDIDKTRQKDIKRILIQSVEGTASNMGFGKRRAGCC